MCGAGFRKDWGNAKVGEPTIHRKYKEEKTTSGMGELGGAVQTGGAKKEGDITRTNDAVKKLKWRGGRICEGVTHLGKGEKGDHGGEQ